VASTSYDTPMPPGTTSTVVVGGWVGVGWVGVGWVSFLGLALGLSWLFVPPVGTGATPLELLTLWCLYIGQKFSQPRPQHHQPCWLESAARFGAASGVFSRRPLAPEESAILAPRHA